MKKLHIKIADSMRIGGLAACIGMSSHALANPGQPMPPQGQPMEQPENSPHDMPGQDGVSDAISSGGSGGYHDNDVGKRSNRFNGPDVDQRSNRFNDDVEDVGVGVRNGTSR